MSMRAIIVVVLFQVMLVGSAVADRPNLRFSTHVHSRYTVEQKGEDADWEHEFSMRRARLAALFRANRFIRAELDVEFADTSPPGIRDAALELKANRWLRITGGRFKKPFSRLSLRGPTTLPLISRGTGNGIVSGDLGFGGRDIGLMLSGRAGVLRWAVGVFNGTGTFEDVDTGKDVTARLDFKLGSGARIGMSGSMQHDNPERITPVQEITFAAGLDTRIRFANVELIGEALWAQERTVALERDWVTGILFGTMTFEACVSVQPIVKLEVIDPDVGNSDRPDFAVLAGANLLLFDSVRIMLQGEMLFPGADSPQEEETTITVQLAFDDKVDVPLWTRKD